MPLLSSSIRPGRLAAVALGLVLLASVGCGNPGSATLQLSEFHFSPERLDATAGKPVTLSLINSGKIEHNWMLDHAVGTEPVHIVLAPGESKTVTFTPGESGSFGYWCTIPGHAPAGMSGTLNVR